ncbi:tumor necrosis factor receptor superfamily member 10B-like isoform X1 [Anarrhichthys ocellatus]|uniref:tumor necrosis factor receptor superfamily member 10B-like isoform X1 n=1 Tax=Anarrhichthys ocellatus TaxID=433405 RepID=UPI0012EECDB1|nr:tumor necrosis factor receptor superfamily member 10B-like isoform X1 [Anarrhichthys ocellatus]
MTKFLLLVVLILIGPLIPTGAFPRPGVDCDYSLEYPSGSICCLNCPAGTRKASPCTGAGEEGKCEECDDGTYTEHGNGLSQCFKCTQCRSDQEIKRPCTHVQDAKCQCKPGGFCAPDQACEACKKCSRCKKDEEIVRNCTSTTNTECKKKHPGPASPSANSLMIVPSLLIPTFIIIGVIIFAVWRCRRTESVRNPPDRRKAGKHDGEYCPTECGETQSCLNLSRTLVRATSSTGASDECKALCESPGSSASNSQLSLTGLPPSAFPAPPPRAVPMQPNRREDVEFPTLVAVNGEVSLRKCFEYFDEIDYSHHKRFFRRLGIVDNVIKSKDHLSYEDKIHDLLTIWVEKEGREATLNDLLRALRDLNQRRTAETVKEKAVLNGHYSVER